MTEDRFRPKKIKEALLSNDTPTSTKTKDLLWVISGTHTQVTYMANDPPEGTDPQKGEAGGGTDNAVQVSESCCSPSSSKELEVGVWWILSVSILILRLVRGEEKEPGIHSVHVFNCHKFPWLHAMFVFWWHWCYDKFHCCLQWLLVCHSSSIQLLMASSVLDAKWWLSNDSREHLRLWGMCTRERMLSCGCPLAWQVSMLRSSDLCAWCDAVLCNFPQSDSAALSRLPNRLTHLTQTCFGRSSFSVTVTSSRSVNREASFYFTAEQLKREGAGLVGIATQHTRHKLAAQDVNSVVSHVHHCTHPQILNVTMVHTHITPRSMCANSGYQALPSPHDEPRN